MICSNCGRKNDDATARFCASCGMMLIHSQPAPAISQPETQRDSPTPTRAEAADALTGRTLDGKYRLDSRLGIGGMGAVFLTTRLHIGDTVAVKILHPEYGADPQFAERFRREAQAAARLKHPNAVSIYDFGITPDGLMFIVMELVEGRSLREIIKLQGPLAPTLVAEVTRQVCSALEEAHSRGIIHRDIKPDNIILHSTGTGLRVKVLDFGIAKLRDLAASNLTETGTVMGTPSYMSPEQCMAEELDNRSDIYSLGIVMYEMLCGVVPFKAPTSTATSIQHVTKPPPSMRGVNASIKPEIEAVVMHAIEKKREARPQTVAELAQEMSAAVFQTAAAVQSGRINLENAASTTTPSARVTSQESMPTIASSTPASGNRPSTPASARLYQNEGASATTKNRKPLPLIIGGIALLVIIGVALGAAAWFFYAGKKEEPSNKPEQAAQTPKPGGPASTQSPATNPADDEFKAFTASRASATTAQKLDELVVAENKYPKDYRFTYEHAKLLITGPDHHEVFGLLYLAGQKAIENGQAKEMLNNLTSDPSTDLNRLKGHDEWKTLIAALTNKDSSALRLHSHH
jgi:serine/threonine protein kinase